MSTPTLLPSGLMDVLPPLAEAEFRLIHHFLKSFLAFGYQAVIPPLAEYSTSLLAGQGEATRHQVFTLPDPLARANLSLRADMTGQVARIATESLANLPRPLRLCYAGSTLRTQPEALKIRRQHTQIGIERFGSSHATAVAEVLSVALYALAQADIQGITIDLHYPSLLAHWLNGLRAHEADAVREAVRLKDFSRLPAAQYPEIAALLSATGPASTTLEALAAIKHPAVARAAEELSALVKALQAHPGITITLDPLDLSGYGYYHGIGYALFWNVPGCELGRGGCYRTAGGEEAVGFTLYINDLLHLIAATPAKPVHPVTLDTPMDALAKLHAQGIVTVFEE